MNRLGLMLVMLAACSDDGTKNSMMNPGTDAAMPSGDVCFSGPFHGSCKLQQGCVDQYGSALTDADVKTGCEQDGNTYSAGHCATAGTVGGCESGVAQSCVLAWYFPPTTTADAMQACPSTSTWHPPT